MSDRAIIEALKRQHDIDALIARLRDKDPSTRSEAAKALGELKDGRAVESLIGALKDPGETKEARGAAVTALGRLGDSRAVEHLIAALSDPNDTESVRTAIVEALERFGDPIAAKLTKVPPIWDSPRVKAVLERPAGTPIDLSGLSEEEIDALVKEAKEMWADHQGIADAVQWVRALREGLSRSFPEKA